MLDIIKCGFWWCWDVKCHVPCAIFSLVPRVYQSYVSTHKCPKITIMDGVSIHPRAKSYILTCQEMLNLGYMQLSVLNLVRKLPHNLGWRIQSSSSLKHMYFIHWYLFVHISSFFAQVDAPLTLHRRLGAFEHMARMWYAHNHMLYVRIASIMWCGMKYAMVRQHFQASPWFPLGPPTHVPLTSCKLIFQLNMRKQDT